MLKEGKYFWFCSLGLCCSSFILMLFQPQVLFSLWANLHHSPAFDWFFPNYTKIAEWPIIVFAILFALYRSIPLGISTGIWYALEGIVVNLMKKNIPAARPATDLSAQIHQVGSETMLYWQSFPSGHTTAAFLGFGFLACMTKSPLLQIMCFIGAALVGYSRMYLGHHYPKDVLAGASIALIILFLFIITKPLVLRVAKKVSA